MGQSSEPGLEETCRVLRACHRVLYRAQGAQALVAGVCAAAVADGAFGLAWFAAQGADGGLGEPVVAGGEGAPALALAAAVGVPPAAGWVVDDAAAVAAPWAQVAVAQGLRSLLLLPVARDGRAIGVFGLAAAAPGCFPASRRALLEELGELLAFGIGRLDAQSERARLAEIVDAVPTLVATADGAGIVREMNRGGLAMLGYASVTQVRGRHWSELLPPWAAARMRESALPTLMAEGAWVGESALLDARGREIPVSQSVTAHKDAQGRVEYLAATAQDIGVLKETEYQLRAYVAELESFAYTVSHDLRAPLRSINGFSQILLEEYGPRLDLQARDYLERIAGSAARMGALIEDILQLSRVIRREMEPEPVDLAALARSVWDALRERREADERFELVLPPSLPARGDRSLLRVLLENLLRNAVKFSRERAQPRVELGRMESAGQSPVFFVRDNGVGFEMEFAGKLFQPFQRLHADARYPGSGIGLAIAKRIAERHHGAIWAEAAPGQGATFFFTLGGNG